MADTQSIIAKDGINLKEVGRLLWHGKVSITLITFLAAFASIVYSLSIPNVYTSSALLASKSSGGGGVSQISSQFGGLASMAGIRLPNVGKGDTSVTIAIETLKSRQFFREYLYETILVELMAATAWDSDSDTLVLDPDVYDEKTGEWVRPSNHPKGQKPTVQQAFSVFSKVSYVEEDEINPLAGLVTISIDHISPEIAKKWVNLMIDGINASIREREVREAERSIEYLKEQLRETPLLNLETVFAQLIEEQTKKIMLAYASKDYVFRTIDPPVATELKTRPQRVRICVYGSLLGLMLGLLWALGKGVFPRRS